MPVAKEAQGFVHGSLSLSLDCESTYAVFSTLLSGWNIIRPDAEAGDDKRGFPGAMIGCSGSPPCLKEKIGLTTDATLFPVSRSALFLTLPELVPVGSKGFCTMSRDQSRPSYGQSILSIGVNHNTDQVTI